MLEFIAGMFTMALIAILLGRAGRARQREITRLHGEMQRAVFRTQDAVTLILLDAPTGKKLLESVDVWQSARATRDQALTAYLAAMGE